MIVRGKGPDVVVGTDLADLIRARGGGRDTVTCGPGRDVVFIDRFDRTGPNCERLR